MINITRAVELGIEEQYSGEWVAYSNEDDDLIWLSENESMINYILVKLHQNPDYNFN